MYLKALEVSNFKSFRGDVTIPLERGFTAITGPNGSGSQIAAMQYNLFLGQGQIKPSELKIRKI